MASRNSENDDDMRESDEISDNESLIMMSPRPKKRIQIGATGSSVYSVYDVLKEKENDIKELEETLNETIRLRKFQNEENIQKIEKLQV